MQLNLHPSIPWLFKMKLAETTWIPIKFIADALIATMVVINFITGYKLWKLGSKKLLIFSLVFIPLSIFLTFILGGFVPIYQETVDYPNASDKVEMTIPIINKSLQF